MAEGDGSRETMVNVIDMYLSTTTVRTFPHAPDLPPPAVCPSSSAVRPRHDGPADWEIETTSGVFGYLGDEDVDGPEHSSHKLAMTTQTKKDGGGSDLNVNGSDGLRAEVCVMRLFFELNPDGRC